MTSKWLPSQIAAQRADKRKSTFLATLNLWPFVAVMLALFMISMGDTRPHQHFWVPVDLAVAANPSPQPAALREDVMRVSIQRDGRVFFRNLRTQAERLPDLIREAVRQGAEAKVYLAVDARSKYGDTNAVVEQIKLSGVSRLCFLVEKAAPK